MSAPEKERERKRESSSRLAEASRVAKGSYRERKLLSRCTAVEKILVLRLVFHLIARGKMDRGDSFLFGIS